MRTTLILIFSVICILACNKKKDAPPTPVQTVDSTDTTQIVKPVLKDSSLKISGIDSIIMSNYDSITIPFTVYTDTGTAQNITLSISKMTMRMRAEFGTTTGTTPLNTTLKLYTYFTGYIPSILPEYDTITITVKKANGDSTLFRYRFNMNLMYCTDMLYTLYLKAPELKTFDATTKAYLGNEAVMHRDPNTKKIYFTNLILGAFNGKIYRTLDDTINVNNNMISDIVMCTYGHATFTFDGKGYSPVDTIGGFFVMSTLLNYYRSLENDYYTYRFQYQVYGPGSPPSQSFYVEGKLKFD